MSVASLFGDAPNGDGDKKRLELANVPLYGTLNMSQQFHIATFAMSWDKMHPVDQYNTALELSIQVLAGQNAAAAIMQQQFKGLDIPLDGMG